MLQVYPYCRAMVAASAVFLLGLMSQAAGCAATPDVQVTGHRLAEAADEAQRVEFLVELTNARGVPIELRELNYRVRDAEGSSYSGRRAAQATLPVGGRIELVVPAVLALKHDEATSAQYHISGSFSYITPGVVARLLRDMGLPRSRVRFAGAVGAEQAD